MNKKHAAIIRAHLITNNLWVTDVQGEKAISEILAALQPEIERLATIQVINELKNVPMEEDDRGYPLDQIASLYIGNRIGELNAQLNKKDCICLRPLPPKTEDFISQHHSGCPVFKRDNNLRGIV